jgi:hypothetical protein
MYSLEDKMKEQGARWLEYLQGIDDTTIPRVVTGEKNSPTVAHACRKRRLKWVLGAWGYNSATQSPGDINMETWSSRLRVGRGTDNPTPERTTVREPKMWPRNSQIDYRDEWGKSIKEAKVSIGL